MLGKVAGAIGRVEDFVVEDAEVEGKTKTDGVCWGEFSLCNIRSILYVGGQYLR